MEHHAHSLSFDTRCLQPPLPRGDGDPLVTPIVHSSTFRRYGVKSTAPHAYSRVSNPTVDALEAALGRLENAPPAVCFGTGLAAESALFFGLLKLGDHVVCGRACYGGTTRLLEHVLQPLGRSVSFVDTTSLDEVRQAVTPFTKLIFIETPANPTLELSDIRAIAKTAHEHRALLAVDNTFQTAVFQQPLELGADLSVYSTTKYIDGHSAALGGAVVSRNVELLERLRFVRKCTGGILSPFNAWTTLQGLKTLPLRLRRQSATALQIARWLDAHPKVQRVHYPGWRDDAQQHLADQQHVESVHGAVISFELTGGEDAAHAFVDKIRLFALCEHVGSVESLVTHPASMTHADVAPDKRQAVGITDDLLRLSIGLEDPQDLIADLDCAIGPVSTCKCTDEEEVRSCAINA